MNLNYVNVAAAGGTTGSTGGGTSTTGSGTTPPTGGGTTVTAVTWNIQVDETDAHARLAVDMALATSPRPQILVFQEAMTAQFGTYIDELQKQTGLTWHGAAAPLCGLGQWTGSTCASTYFQSVAIFTTFDIVNSDAMFFPYADCWQSARTGLRAGVNVGGTTLQVFTTHLQHDDGCANDAQSRYKSMSMLKTWAANYSSPQIVGGDFNAQADQSDSTSGMSPQFVDVWASIGSGAGLTAFLPSPTVRIDYWFRDAAMTVVPQTIEVVPNTGTVSDHAPVRMTVIVP